MKKIIMIKIPGCPYCAKARKAIEELHGEEKYKSVPVEEIDETTQPELAKPYGKDYYYVPSLFIDGKKQFEAKPGMDYDTIKAAVVKAFDEALK
ncbi:glutaredoxin family protein [uncultured Dialister sp.]|jgi:glutaredoxin|uniref:glutaredoxin family protein n=1 Tax=Dialister sp. TaxID=1955814 RepID=UPI0025E37B8A|nr:glutaredoxin family protein [uncultured Dialister sp.]